jgi:hypothetical protein
MGLALALGGTGCAMLGGCGWGQSNNFTRCVAVCDRCSLALHLLLCRRSAALERLGHL